MKNNPHSKFKLILIIFIIYIIAVVISEQFYREYLFKKSIKIETDIYNKSSKKLITFFKIITEFGTVLFLIPLLIIIHITLPINISYTFLSVLILSAYYDNILKIIYSSPRPFWIKTSIKNECDGGFGNPSGHSFSSFSVFLSLWNILIENIKSFQNQFCRIFLFFIFFSFAFLIALSRIFLCVHSINQILYGGLLGFGLYFYFFHIIKLHKYSGKKFFKYISDSKYIKIHSVKYFIYVIILLLVYFFRKSNWKEYDNLLTEKCPNIPLYRKFNNDGFFIGLSLFLLIGAHYGLYFFIIKIQVDKPFKNEEINNWSLENNLKFIFYKLLIAIIHCLPMIFYLVIPDDFSLAIIYPIKTILPFLLTGILLNGTYFYFCIKYKIAYKQIYVNYRIGTEAENNNSMSSIAIEVKIRDSNEINNLNK